MHRHDAVPVGPTNGQLGGERTLAEVAFEPPAGLELSEPRGDNDRAPAPRLAGGRDDFADPGGGDRYYHRIRGLRQVSQRGHARMPQRFGALRVDPVDRPREARRF